MTEKTMNEIFTTALETGEFYRYDGCKMQGLKAKEAICEIESILGSELFSQIEDSIMDAVCASELFGFVGGYNYLDTRLVATHE